ncbi:hypothetical protein [Candidatus Sodalis pierantonius]|uniref:hypothetical protein n=1 Tax=Candidatus Sodalis pierantonii TaxID=1486991 RepID=UPI0006844A8E|nr:hypothetical protein [Candidatus Sodalis pierantonius]
MANLIRAFLLDLFREAIAEGLIKSNPVEATRNQRVEVKRKRMTLEDWKGIRKAADTLSAWVGPCLDLALVHRATTGRYTGATLGRLQAW